MIFQGELGDILQVGNETFVRMKEISYPEAPVPKSMATMCVYYESSFKKAI